MMPRSVPKAILGASRVEDPQKVERCISFLEPFGVSWAILAAIRSPAGPQGAPKIEFFGTKSHQNLKKWGPEWGIKKYMNI